MSGRRSPRGDGRVRGDRPGGPIRWRLHLPVPPSEVYEALNTDDGRASFWAESLQGPLQDGERFADPTAPAYLVAD